MKLELKKERMNPHLKRKELEIEVDHENGPTPTKQAIHDGVASQFHHSPEYIDVRGVYSFTGSAKSRAKVFVWTEKKIESTKEEKKETKQE